MYSSFKIYTILIGFHILNASCDYYSTLGVRKNATEREIEKAFRKKAKQLHPDANPGNEKQFAEVSNAYEVLKDPDKRKKYDAFGEEGLKHEGPQGHPYQHYYRDGHQTFFTFEGFDFDDIFNNFGFGGGGPGRGRRQGHQAHQEQEFQPSVDFKNTIVEEVTPTNYEMTLKTVRALNLYYFYNPNSRACVNAHKAFVDTVTKFKGAVNVYAVNCAKHAQFCAGKAQNVPTLIAHKAGAANPLKFGDSSFAVKLEIWIHNAMPSELVELKSLAQLEEFVHNQPITHVGRGKPQVVAVVKKSLYLTLLKSMSSYLRNKVKIGYIRASNRELAATFRKARTETAVVFHVEQLEPFKGARASSAGRSIELTADNFSDVLLWLNLKQNEFKKRGSGAYKELTRQLMDAGECGPRDNQFCFLFVKYGGRAEHEIDRALPAIAQRFAQDAVKLRFVTAPSQVGRAHAQHKFVAAFGLSSRCPATETCTKFVAYRGKRKRFKVMNAPLTPANVTKFIEDVITGSAALDRHLAGDPTIIDYSNDEL